MYFIPARFISLYHEAHKRFSESNMLAVVSVLSFLFLSIFTTAQELQPSINIVHLDHGCPPGFSSYQVSIITYRVFFPVLLNIFIETDTMISLNGVGNQINITNAPASFSIIFTATTTTTVTSTLTQSYPHSRSSRISATSTTRTTSM